MLEWKEIKGYDAETGYGCQDGMELPEPGEEILIWFQNGLYPDRPPFAGYFREIRHHRAWDCRVWMVNAANGGMLAGMARDGVKRAGFNRP